MIFTALKLHASVVGRFRHDDEGATAVEYGLLVGLIAIAAIAGFSLYADEVLRMFTAWSEAVSVVADAASTPPLD